MKSQQAHTPGPWHTFDGEIVASSSDVHIADIPLNDGINPTEWQANMRLIAAAPEMLAALKETLGYWTATGFAYCDKDCDCIVESVRGAIAKAES